MNSAINTMYFAYFFIQRLHYNCIIGVASARLIMLKPTYIFKSYNSLGLILENGLVLIVL